MIEVPQGTNVILHFYIWNVSVETGERTPVDCTPKIIVIDPSNTKTVYNDAAHIETGHYTKIVGTPLVGIYTAGAEGSGNVTVATEDLRFAATPRQAHS